MQTETLRPIEFFDGKRREERMSCPNLERDCLSELCFWFEEALKRTNAAEDPHKLDKMYLVFDKMQSMLFGAKQPKQLLRCLDILRPGYFGVDMIGSLFHQVELSYDYISAMDGWTYWHRITNQELVVLVNYSPAIISRFQFLAPYLVNRQKDFWDALLLSPIVQARRPPIEPVCKYLNKFASARTRLLERLKVVFYEPIDDADIASKKEVIIQFIDRGAMVCHLKGLWEITSQRSKSRQELVIACWDFLGFSRQ